jgi:hypothetical protein
MKSSCSACTSAAVPLAARFMRERSRAARSGPGASSLLPLSRSKSKPSSMSLVEANVCACLVRVFLANLRAPLLPGSARVAGRCCRLLVAGCWVLLLLLLAPLLLLLLDLPRTEDASVSVSVSLLVLCGSRGLLFWALSSEDDVEAKIAAADEVEKVPAVMPASPKALSLAEKSPTSKSSSPKSSSPISPSPPCGVVEEACFGVW